MPNAYYQNLIHTAAFLPEPNQLLRERINYFAYTNPPANTTIIINHRDLDSYYRSPWFYYSDPSFGFFSWFSGYRAGQRDAQTSSSSNSSKKEGEMGILAILTIIALVIAALASASYALKRLSMSFHNVFTGHKVGAALVRIGSILATAAVAAFVGGVIGTSIGASTAGLGAVAGFWLGLSVGAAFGSATMSWLSQKFTRGVHHTDTRNNSRLELRSKAIQSILETNQVVSREDIDIANAILIGQMNRARDNYKETKAYLVRQELKQGNAEPAKQYLAGMLLLQSQRIEDAYGYTCLFTFCQRNQCLPQIPMWGSFMPQPTAQPPFNPNYELYASRSYPESPVSNLGVSTSCMVEPSAPPPPPSYGTATQGLGN